MVGRLPRSGGLAFAVAVNTLRDRQEKLQIGECLSEMFDSGADDRRLGDSLGQDGHAGLRC